MGRQLCLSKTIREELDPNTIYRKPFGQSTRYPLESYRTHFLWGGKNGTKPIRNEEGIFSLNMCH